MESVAIYDPGNIFADLGCFEHRVCLSLLYINTL